VEGGQTLDVLLQAPDLGQGRPALVALWGGRFLAAPVPGEAGEAPLALALLSPAQGQVQLLRLEAAELPRLLKLILSLVRQESVVGSLERSSRAVEKYIVPLLNAATATRNEPGSGTEGKSG